MTGKKQEPEFEPYLKTQTWTQAVPLLLEPLLGTR